MKIYADNKTENTNRVDYEWQVGDLCLITRYFHREVIRKVEHSNKGSYNIIQVHINRSVYIQYEKVFKLL